ncbi:aldolase [Paenibacillus doosanensis]|uniref:aldolase n=1 Tax=Paenibacillus doosanensis TaxID=1229154 RepID=UPI00217F6156|nr:aldolase [Paenibacillus doosanensis]MCS7461010.1 aldolase [Paenibacillus doosanensis]
MIQTENKVVYKAFDLSIASGMELPELPVIHRSTGRADVEIIVDPAARFGAGLESRPYYHDVRNGEVTFHVPGNANYSIREGRVITVAPLPSADEGLTRLYVLGTCMGALLMQRRKYPLHGSAVAIGGKAYAIVGESGAGKSTLASAFIQAGYTLVSDDLISVSLSPVDETAVVTPSFPQQKLWRESLEQFGMETGTYRSIYGRETKYSVPVATHYCAQPLPLGGVIELVKTEEPEVSIHPISKLDRLQTLFRHTFRHFLIPRLGLMEWHFQTSAAIAGQAAMFQLRRPAGGFTAPQLVSLLLENLRMEE